MIRANRMRWLLRWKIAEQRGGFFSVWWRGMPQLKAWLSHRGFIAPTAEQGKWQLTAKGLAAFDDSVRAYQRHGRRWWR